MNAPSAELLAVARRWVDGLDKDGLHSVELAVDPSDAEIRLVCVADDFEDLDGDPLPFRLRALPGTPYHCTNFSMGPTQREAFRRGAGTWPEEWGSFPKLIPLYEKPAAAGLYPGSVDRPGSMFKAIEDILPGDVLFGGLVVSRVGARMRKGYGERVVLWFAGLDGSEPGPDAKPNLAEVRGTQLELEG